MTSGEHPSVYTIGHSTRTIVEFVTLLRAGRVELVVDVRSTPRSRTNPQFNLDALPEALSAWQIGHTRIEDLGGRRNKSKTVPPEVNGFWINQSFHNYADYALSDEFRVGFSHLTKLSRERGARSCVRRRFGGIAIGGSLLITSCMTAGTFFI